MLTIMRTTLVLLLSFGLLGCEVDPFSFTQGGPDTGGGVGDGGGLADGTGGGDGGAGDGGEGDACVPTEELCDEVDNDCDGEIDNVDPSRLLVDPRNCGGCGNLCSYINAFAECDRGNCVMGSCAPGFHDNNSDDTDGCEYQCLTTNGGREDCPASEPTCACDNVDNDCDGEVDEGFDKDSDLNNCGECGNRCAYTQAAASCNQGVCEMGDCTEGFVDNNADDTDGCEYRCPVFPVENEICNGIDDDCDGEIDEGLPGSGEDCDTGLLGECAAGVTACQGNELRCTALKEASGEICDGLDNDCDGEPDEDFDFNTSLLHCGRCDNPCTYQNGIPACVDGVCQLARCNDGFVDFNNDLDDGCEYQCGVFPPSVEKCNGKDDDCDKQVDEDFDLQNDPNHCGSCTTVCSYLNAQAQCVSGECQMGNCDPNYFDANNSTADGCEYFCIESNGGTEACDGVDNNCDGVADEIFDFDNDVNNCGSCGNICIFNNAAASCVGGQCQMGACADGFANLDNQTVNGCEYECPVPPTTAPDDCDGVDTDCDGAIDEDFVGGTCGTDEGLCTFGTERCEGGVSICDGGVRPVGETCNGQDDDCDGTIDNGYAKDIDPRNCGPNCVACALDNAIAACTSGQCTIAVCLEGFVDRDGQPGNGCEYQCTVTGVEICDGLDNDCDGDTDEGVSLSANPCRVVSDCAGTTATCQGTLGWVCNYPADVELRPCSTRADCSDVVDCDTVNGVCPGLVASEETLCDNFDNDCDGQDDETYPAKGDPCADPDTVGACQGTGNLICDLQSKTATVCNITTPGAENPVGELCNGIDDDCDGLVDEEDFDGYPGVTDAMIEINRSGHHFWIYAYEASRPDADASNLGTITARACSKPNVRPWSDIDWVDADAACQASGKRLCTATEWYLACSGASGWTYPYADSYQALTCNGKDNDGSTAPGDQDVVVPTGSKTGCVQAGVYDMSGNLMEWTGTQVEPSPPAYRIRGGSFNNIAEGLTCDLDFIAAETDFLFGDLGFRCCSDSAP